MAKMKTYKCPGTDGESHTFTFLHHPSDEPPPRYCPKCGYDSQSDSDVIEFHPAVTSPRILAGKTKSLIRSADQTYRQYEKASEDRAEEAAALLNVPKSEMSDLKITNFETQLRQGDLAVKPVDNHVSQTIQSSPGMFGFQGTQAAAFASSAHTGRTPDGRAIKGDVSHAGAKAGKLVSDFHNRVGNAMVRAGETGRY